MRRYLHDEILRVKMPYLVLGAVVLLWALLIALKKFPPHSQRARRRAAITDISAICSSIAIFCWRYWRSSCTSARRWAPGAI